MDPKLWSVVVLSPNKFIAKVQVDLFRQSGAKSVYIAYTAKDAMKQAWDHNANIIVIDLSDDAQGMLQFAKSIRQLGQSPVKKAFIFGASSKMTTGVIEQCRLAGVNAAIGLPLSMISLIHTVKKVIAKPRPFIEHSSYVGPCRRAGILSVEAVKNKRRSADSTIPESQDGTQKTA